MLKKYLFAFYLIILFSNSAQAAGTGDSSSSKVKSDYDKAVTLIKQAKKYEKKGKTEKAKNHVFKMVKNQSLNCHSGKQIPCEIDSICIHGDNLSSLETARSIKNNLLKNKLKLKPLNEMEKFI